MADKTNHKRYRSSSVIEGLLNVRQLIWSPVFHHPRLSSIMNLLIPSAHAGEAGEHERASNEAIIRGRDASIPIHGLGPDISFLGKFLAPTAITIDGIDLTFGEISAMAGDHYRRFDGTDDTYQSHLQQLGSEQDTLMGASASDIWATKAILGHERGDEIGSEIISDMGEWLYCHNAVICDIDDEDVEENTHELIKKFNHQELRHALLAITNWDHFHPHSIERYTKLHQRACNEARAAVRGVLGSVDFGGTLDFLDFDEEMLRRAFACEAFALHFLEDSFSAGHLIGATYRHYRKKEKPRQHVLINADGRPVFPWEVWCGYKRKRRHDEYSKEGVLAYCNARPAEQGYYEVFGDGELFRHIEDSFSFWNNRALERKKEATYFQAEDLWEAVSRSLQDLVRSMLIDTDSADAWDISSIPNQYAYIPHIEDSSCCEDDLP